MAKKQPLSTMILVLMIICLLAINIQARSKSREAAPPVIKQNAPVEIQLLEDSPNYYLDLKDIYLDPNDNLTYTIKAGIGWGTTFFNDIITINVKTNDTLEFIPKDNMHGECEILLNATNPQELSTNYNLKVKIKPVNDPPVIQSIGNFQTKGAKLVTLFTYQSDWFNETVTAYDADGDPLVFLDNSTMFDIGYQTGEISFRPDNNDVGTTYFNLTVSDINGTNCEDWVNVKLTVLNVNDPPSATILKPQHGDKIYNDYYIWFEGEGNDPDLKFGDKLEYEWSSDVDGILGNREAIEFYYLTEGKHVITFKVTDNDGLYDEDSINITVTSTYIWQNIDLTLDNYSYIAYQNELVTIPIVLTNYGMDNDNISLELVNHFELSGKIGMEYENVTLDSDESILMNLTISIPSDEKIGLYPMDIIAESSFLEDFYRYDYDEYADIESIMIFVLENDTANDNKQANKPTWDTNHIWEYSMKYGSEYDSSFIISGTMTASVTEESTIEVNKEDYEVYAVDFEGELESKGDSSDPDYADITLTLKATEYYQRSDLALVSSNEKSEISSEYYGYEISYSTILKTTYEPPKDSSDFPLKPGESWTVKTYAEIEETECWEEDGEDDCYTDYSWEYQTITYLCLGTEEVSTPAGTFETYPIIIVEESSSYDSDPDYDDKPGGGGRSSGSGTRQNILKGMNDYYIEYYAPDVKTSIKSVGYSRSYDYDSDYWEERYVWTEIFDIELTSYSFNDTGVDPDPEDNTKTDEDEDNLPDDWEDEFDVEEPDEDDDGDGYTNEEEYESGTDPTNAEDTPDDPIDLDDDGMPDAWERYHGLDPTDSTDASEDPDGDGFDNLEEYDYNTLPFDPVDHPIIDDNTITTEDDEEDSIFGLGKIGGVNIVYIVLLIVAILIVLILFSFMKSRQKSAKPAEIDAYPKDEPRVPSAPVPESGFGTPTTVPRQYQNRPPGEVIAGTGTTGYDPSPRRAASPPQVRPAPTPVPYQARVQAPPQRIQYTSPVSRTRSYPQQPPRQPSPPPPPPDYYDDRYRRPPY
ncbi:MAG: hypothetical protein JSV49_08630 [Thermoplasmata archaeon]|nr:MAG: hypothetical protein JSV49_08630 [Thermoplasmata archaeon]